MSAARTADDLIRWLGAERDRLIGLTDGAAMSSPQRLALKHQSDALTGALAHIAVHWRPPAETKSP